jgi:hypothetical protein
VKVCLLGPAPPRAGAGGGAPGVAGFQFHGTPQTIIEQVGVYRDAGVGIIDVGFAPDVYGCGGDRAKQAMGAVRRGAGGRAGVVASLPCI